MTWGQAPQNQPPDVEQVIRLAQEKLANLMPNGKGLWTVVFIVIAILWLSSGIYVVGPDEEGVVVRFGRYVQTTGSGLNYHLPYPVESVYKPKVTQVQRIEIGYRSRDRAMVDVQGESLMLTGDENIIDIDMSVQYRIHNAADYLFNVRNPTADPFTVVRNAAESAIRQVIGRSKIDDALTTGKALIQENTKKAMQDILNLYQSGLLITAVQLQQVAPPQEVVHAFKDVASAREDRERAINEAEGYSNDILPKAKGEAARQLQEAEGYKLAKVSRAEGEVKRFLALLTEYNKAKEVTKTRLYLESMEEVLTGMNKVLVSPNASNGVLPFLPLNQKNGQQPPQTGKGE
ncbi:MAG: FtsH protease activity modulator HflK [Magnetococcus sp. DMHC-6]